MLPAVHPQVRQYALFNAYVSVSQLVSSAAVTGLSLVPGCSRLADLMLLIVSAHSGVFLALEKALQSEEKKQGYQAAAASARAIWDRLVCVPLATRGTLTTDNMVRTFQREFTAWAFKLEEVQAFARDIETFSGHRTYVSGSKGTATGPHGRLAPTTHGSDPRRSAVMHYASDAAGASVAVEQYRNDVEALKDAIGVPSS